MKVKRFYRPKNVKEVMELLSKEPNSQMIAGGTDLIIDMNERHKEPDVLIDISNIKEMQRIWEENNILHIGAAATFSEIQNNALVKEYCPCLCDAASQVGGVQIRNRATLGGNVANAGTAGDGIPSLLSMDAIAIVENQKGSREIPVSEILVGINKNSLGNDEIITEFQIKAKPNAIKLFEKIGRRKALAISRINLAVCLEKENNKIIDISVAVGAVGPTAYRVEEVEEFLINKDLSDEVIEDASKLIDEVVSRNLDGRSTAPYKSKIAYAVLNRALNRSLQEEE